MYVLYFKMEKEQNSNITEHIPICLLCHNWNNRSTYLKNQQTSLHSMEVFKESCSHIKSIFWKSLLVFRA